MAVGFPFKPQANMGGSNRSAQLGHPVTTDTTALHPSNKKPSTLEEFNYKAFLLHEKFRVDPASGGQGPSMKSLSSSTFQHPVTGKCPLNLRYQTIKPSKIIAKDTSTGALGFRAPGNL